MPTALIILATGFEETEAVSVIDILRRANISLTMASLEKNLLVEGAHQIHIQADTSLDKVSDQLFDAIILPGGEPGTSNLEKSKDVKTLITAHHQEGKLIAAICAAPRILDRYGLLSGKKATSYPGTKPMMQRCNYQEQAVVIDGQFMTSQGVGTSVAFSLEIVKYLKSEEISTRLQEAIVA